MSEIKMPQQAKVFRPGRKWLGLGLLLPVLAAVVYAIQISAGRLTTPWYLVAATAIGSVLCALAVYHNRTLIRVGALVILLLMLGFEATVLYQIQLPHYSGPATVGATFPTFTAKRSDGTPFTQADLIGSQDTVLVFFRGRW